MEPEATLLPLLRGTCATRGMFAVVVDVVVGDFKNRRRRVRMRQVWWLWCFCLLSTRRRDAYRHVLISATRAGAEKTRSTKKGMYVPDVLRYRINRAQSYALNRHPSVQGLSYHSLAGVTVCSGAPWNIQWFTWPDFHCSVTESVSVQKSVSSFSKHLIRYTRRLGCQEFQSRGQNKEKNRVNGPHGL